jgi:hypothetical protein
MKTEKEKSDMIYNEVCNLHKERDGMEGEGQKVL